MCWRAAHRERPASFVSWKPRRKRLADGSLGRRKIPAFRAGRRARIARLKQGRGPKAPAPALVLRSGGPQGPQIAKRRRPADEPHASLFLPASAPPSALRRLPGGAGRTGRTIAGAGTPTATRSPSGCVGPAEMGCLPRGRIKARAETGGRRRLAARGPWGPWACQTKKQEPEAKPPAPAFQGASRPATAPPPLGFPPTPKGHKKPGLSACPAPLRPPPGKRW